MSDTTAAVARHSTRALVTQSVLGLVVGALIYLVVAFASVAAVAASHALPLVLIAIVAGAGVFLGWRWPALAITAGGFILLVSLLIAAFSISTPVPLFTFDVFAAVVYGAASGYVVIVGVVLICSSMVRRLPLTGR
ncbi:hypothetical protein [Microbacterium sp. PRC9]|uniref:hypothetical protein n=1 Tax=Microbacterium sp. PRC9 TaxID=2962591 RepID=UPI002881EABD|nr:hypothetical protein [Microbacterium sp. PRC9]MDT0143673.1 hypothetical protein [Microbacterium sp. PRC9]